MSRQEARTEARLERWDAVAGLLRHPSCQGAGAIRLLAREDLYDEGLLPFRIHGAGTVLRVEPEPAFRREALAGSPDEAHCIVLCPDAPGWLVPEEVVAGYLARHVACPELEDLLVSHPLFEHLTRPDEEGLSRMGRRGGLVHWVPGVPNLAVLRAPEFLPGDPEAPKVNRSRRAYSEAVADLLGRLDEAFRPLELEVACRF